MGNNRYGGCLCVPQLHGNPGFLLRQNAGPHLFRLNDYRALSPRLPQNCFAPGLELKAYSLGMGTPGLPGDLTSQPRFVRAAFTRLHSVTEETKQASVSQTRGCCDTGEVGLEFTQYISCFNADKGIFIIPPVKNIRLRRWICAGRSWTVTSWSAIRSFDRNRFRW